MGDILNRKEAIELLKIPEKYFDNYHKNSGEISGFKDKGRWYFKKKQLIDWDDQRKKRTVNLSLKEYEKCFEFAIKMAYISKGSHGTGIRGARSEVQMADDFILGILAEHGCKHFLKKYFNIKIKLDMAVHPDHITPQDFVGIFDNGKYRDVQIGVAVKASKFKNCYNIIHPLEYEKSDRKSDVYIYARVGLPSDHLFRILRDHSFFKNVKEFLEKSKGYRKILELKNIPIWICGFSYHHELEKVMEIPGQTFEPEYRFVKSVKDMRSSDKDWERLVGKM